MRALISPPEGGFTIEDLPNDDTLLRQLQSKVAGYIEAVSGSRWVAYVNEEGKLEGLPTNWTATASLNELLPSFAGHDVIVGTAVFLGVRADGAETDVPQRIIDVFQRQTA